MDRDRDRGRDTHQQTSSLTAAARSESSQSARVRTSLAFVSGSFPKMYPRAKVSEHANVITKEDEAMDFILRVVKSLSFEMQPPLRSTENKSEIKYKVNLSSPLAKISVSDHPKTPQASSTSRHKGKTTRSFHGENKTKARANSVPRPRAVISSPENDDLIGNLNRTQMERQSKPQSTSKNLQSEVILSYKNDRSGFSTKDKRIFTPKFPDMRAKVYSEQEPRILVKREKSD